MTENYDEQKEAEYQINRASKYYFKKNYNELSEAEREEFHQENLCDKFYDLPVRVSYKK